MSIHEVITGRATNPGAGGAAATPGSGDSFTVREFQSGNAYIENVWGQAASASVVRINSPRMHDPVESLRFRIPAAVIRGEMADEVRQPIQPADALSVNIIGGAAETDAMAMLVTYENLGGNDARLMTWPQVQGQVRNFLSHEVLAVTSATTGDWPAGNALTGVSDILKAGVDYAVLGYVVDTACLAVALRGADTGNLRFGGPGPVEPLETRDWFISLSQQTGAPAIPVISGTNKGSVLIFAAAVAISANINVNLMLAELSGRGA